MRGLKNGARIEFDVLWIGRGRKGEVKGLSSLYDSIMQE